MGMTSKWNNHRVQTNPWHREEETHITGTHNTMKVKQPALSSSAGWLLNQKGHQEPRHEARTQLKTSTHKGSNSKQWINNNSSGGSRISGKGVHMYKGGGGSLC